MASFSRGVELHYKVIHKEPSTHADEHITYQKSCEVCLEERFISKLTDNTLRLVCSDCFGPKEL